MHRCTTTLGPIGLDVPTAVRISQRVLRVAAMFGLGVDEGRTMRIIPPTCMPLPRGGVVFITGPSGGGKSSLLRAVGSRCVERDQRVMSLDDLPTLPDVPLVDGFEVSLQQTMSVLARAGLADAFVMLRRPRELSDGQRYRLRLAHLLVGAEVLTAGSVVLLVDEFVSSLDRLTARVVARNIARWVRRTPHTLVCATAHDDLLDALEPEVLVWKGLGDAIEVHAAGAGGAVGEGRAGDDAFNEPVISIRGALTPDPSPGGSGGPENPLPLGEGGERSEPGEGRAGDDAFNEPVISIRRALTPDPSPGGSGGPARQCAGAISADLCIERGAFRDYRQLASFHYLGNEPRGVETVWRLVHRAPTVVGRFLHRRDETSTVGVLVRAYPRLGGTLRDLATSGRYRGLGAAAGAALINREVRTIARVIVDPRWRGMGLAVRLVRHALALPATILTEALAAMGRVHPFFERAGMTAYDQPPVPADARLLDALDRLEIEPHRLASSALMLRTLDACGADARQWFERELRCWRRAVQPERRGVIASLTIDDLLRTARQRLLVRPVYYLFDHRR